MIKFSIAQLEAFDSICRLGTFRAAAHALHVTQPTITLRIRELESTLGVPLFVRHGRTAKVSEEGAVIAKYAAQVLLMLNQMQDQLQTNDPLEGALRIGTSDMVAITCLPQIIQMIELAYPRLTVELMVTHSMALSELMNANKLDFAILANPDVQTHIKVEPLALADVAWLGARKKRLPVSETNFLRPKDLADINVLTVPAPSTLNTIIHGWCGTDRAPMPVVNTCNSIAIIAQLVVTGVAMSVLPICVLQDQIDGGTVVRYRQSEEFLPLKMCIAYRKAIRSQSTEGVLKIVREVMARSGKFTMI
jgi:DNA-binding transcriptional LysR family regulator